MSYITTYLKKHFDPVNTNVADIDICDIAHALSLICRANGHFPHFYSVAQHSLNCAIEAKARGYSKRVQLGCLLHDASEAYLSDVTRPVKALLPQYLDVEEKLQNAIFDKWIVPSLTEEECKLVFEVDDAVLYHEFLAMMGERIFDSEPTMCASMSCDFEEFSLVEEKYIRHLNRLLGKQEPRYVGVDWMAGKWLAVSLEMGLVSYKSFDKIEELCAHYEDAERILIDVPIGLPETAEEMLNRPDVSARKYLAVAARKSSLFNVPYRQMVYAETKQRFWELRDSLGAKVSVQSQGIVPCIRDVDTFLFSHPEWAQHLNESHPECAFQALNGGNGLLHSKHTPEGIQLRIDILSRYVSGVQQLIDKAPKKAKEDILDALCLAVTASLDTVSIPTVPKTDRLGLPMQIVIARNVAR